MTRTDEQIKNNLIDAYRAYFDQVECIIRVDNKALDNYELSIIRIEIGELEREFINSNTKTP